ncbi:MAG: class II glutamine amidotransferase [Alphaproteobacteria bacterium]|nr:class II glutamine amidotransferase [Alphaproteobacteria bacterium]
MCELFAMSSEHRSTVNYSLPEFAKHGGLTHNNKSGWGIAYFQDRDALLIREPSPAADSPWVKFIAEQYLASFCVIAHVRMASVGKPTLHNTHPFRRALGGRYHVFAHNGTLNGIHDEYDAEDLDDRPVGETDSELAFCILLQRLRPGWRHIGDAPTVESRFEIFAEFAAEMRRMGSSNFLYSDGEVLFVHADKRVYEEEGGHLSEPHPPGLSLRNWAHDGPQGDWECKGLKIGRPQRTAVLFASVPLDADGWEPLPEGCAIAVDRGTEVARASTL